MSDALRIAVDRLNATNAIGTFEGIEVDGNLIFRHSVNAAGEFPTFEELEYLADDCERGIFSIDAKLLNDAAAAGRIDDFCEFAREHAMRI